MSHTHPHHDPTVPRGAVIGAASMLVFVMALTGAVKWGLIPVSADPVASRLAANVAPVQTRDLRFTDEADGTVSVNDATSGETVSIIAFGKGGFLRATMRRMAKQRRAAGIGAEPPFTLIRWDNGALSLKDPMTGHEAEIYGFGPDHTKAFADMLKDPAA
jgi:putative photosynthetic complex assembly protein